MTISIWRYSHLALALSSFLFIALASITGAVLAFEPVSQKIQPYKAPEFNALKLSDVIPAVKKNYTSIAELSVDPNNFVIVHGTDAGGNDVEEYVHPKTGQRLGAHKKQSDFFQWVTTLHRSLFLHETGRFFIGLTAFLLLLIALSGTVLVVKRQRGFRRFFTKVVRENFAQYAHVMLGRLSLVPIGIIALSGTILSLNTFGLLKDEKIVHDINMDAIRTAPETAVQDIAIFKNTLLSQLKTLEFPFSEFPEDYYTLKLKDREIVVNQVTGDLLSEKYYSRTKSLIGLGMNLHTGRASWVWAVILGIASVNILFFIWSGFVITLRRRSGRIKNKYKAAKSRFIILVGSENGSTFRFAKAVYDQLINHGEAVFLTELNKYEAFPKAEHIVVITATYGLGNPPTNAAKFEQLVKKYKQQQPTRFSVVGLGSHAYPDFCKFAFEVNNWLSAEEWAVPLLEIHTVHDKSPAEFGRWVELWSQKTGVPLSFSQAYINEKLPVPETFTVVANKTTTPSEPVFVVQLRAGKPAKFRSGDLLAVNPANDHRERLYSIGKVNGLVQLSVKLHPGGLGSGYLHSLQPGDKFAARIVSNPHFHFPKKAPIVIMISNGTGIAPFLGMINENARKAQCRLYCGFRSAGSFSLYKNDLQVETQKQHLHQLQVAFSREGEKQYVKDLLLRDADLITAALEKNGVIMLCGSLAMQKDVIALLEMICLEKNKKTVSFYQSHGQILMDCY